MRRLIILFPILALAGCALLGLEENLMVYSHLGVKVDDFTYRAYAIYSISQREGESSMARKQMEAAIYDQLIKGLARKGFTLTKRLDEADFWLLVGYANSYTPQPKPARLALILQQNLSLQELEGILPGESLNYSRPHLEVLFYDPYQERILWHAFVSSSREKVPFLEWSRKALRLILRRSPFSGDYGGIGVVLHREKLYILKIYQGSPADVSGLQPRDVILAVNGIKVTDYNQCLRLLKGRPNTPVTITVLRRTAKDNGERQQERELTYQLTRWPVNKFYHLN